MNSVGIDVSNGRSMVAVLRPLGEEVRAPFEVRHDAASLSSLSRELHGLDGEIRVVMEHTERYYESVAKSLHESGLFVSAVNPLLIKEYGNNSLRKVKTDEADARKIAKYGLDNWADLRDYTPMDEIRYNFKTLNRQFQPASKTRTALANNLIALQEQSFPGICKCFDSPVRSDGHQKWVDFTHAFWHVGCVGEVSRSVFTERYRKWCRENHYNFSLDKAVKVYELVKSVVVLVPKDDVTKMLVQEAATQLTDISYSSIKSGARVNRTMSV